MEVAGRPDAVRAAAGAAERPDDAPRHWTAEGTMALVDISGFTSLSEQLAARGRVGAEDLVSTLTRIFTLLMSATDDGGDVVKFAGDALLVLYDGPDHELHACHAASRPPAPAGGRRAVSACPAPGPEPRMSVGVHTGHFEMLLTGGDHQNLVVAGPDLDRVLELQAAADAGEVLVSPERSPRCCPRPRPRQRDRGGVVRSAGCPPMASVGVASPGPSAPRPTPRGFLPAAFAERTDLLVADSDHRRAAMGFVQVGGLDARLARRARRRPRRRSTT